MDTLELVLRQSHGAILIPLKRTATILGMEPQTIRNRLSLHTFPIYPVHIGRSVFFRADDIAHEIDQAQQHPQRRGAPRTSEQVTAEQAGMSIKELRTQHQGGRQKSDLV